MTWFRYAQDVYGQDILLGASWGLIWWFAAAAAAFIVLHLVFKLLARGGSPAVTMTGNPKARMVRHHLIDRLYHWIMACSMVTLLVTAFAPLLGWSFGWVTIHWIAGVILALLVGYHIIRAIGWQDIWAMTPGLADLCGVWRTAARALSRRGPTAGLPGKYTLLQKLYHWGIASMVLALIGTGALMLSKIDTPFWQRNPYWLSQDTWGIVYTVHDFCALFALSLVMVHIYFGLRPEKLWLLRSMILGWITRGEYLANHDPKRWLASDPTNGSER